MSTLRKPMDAFVNVTSAVPCDKTPIKPTVHTPFASQRQGGDVQPLLQAVAASCRRDVRVRRKVGDVTVFVVEGVESPQALLFTPTSLAHLRQQMQHRNLGGYQFYPYLLWLTHFGELAATELKVLDWSNLASHLQDWFKRCGGALAPRRGVVIVSGHAITPPRGLAPLGHASSKQTGPPPIQANLFWWPLEAGPNNDPSWPQGLSLEELYRELKRTMDKLQELGDPGIWRGCKEYNDWQRHRELLLESLRRRQRG